MKIVLCDNNQREMGKIEKSINLHFSQKYEFDFFSSGKKLIRHFKKNEANYSIYFISIELNDMDSIALAQQIRKSDREALIIFVSNDIQRMPDVFQVHAFDYLLKPIADDRLLETMTRATNYFNAIHAYFEFSFNRKLIVLTMNDIVYIAKSGRIAYIHTTEKVYKTYLTMAEIVDKLNKDIFTRIHGSYIVNLNYIVKIIKSEVFVKQFENNMQQDSPTSLPMSRTFKDNAKESYSTFLRLGKS
ncbi:hypothetical protein A5821_002332 [Enterococcus sp. 7F3_DIV0205]|uniref:Response regulatory domain-containing protein n=1 Tax=Candidatus Enterococcus palustris TaxID=1834189 RepID=A0AAQ3Y7W3_9ENTE|nr:LytTR family DNA-binding domain-containing protein [Enterococcus sp. 7F3_DIV0205]OTN82762.1 hypothetical protein A5821_002685 [Enterococcus sp. 7F3_DIV0205]